MLTDRRNVSTLTNETDYLLPYWLNYMGGDWHNRTQCLNPGSNEWLPTQTAFNGGLNDQWPAASAPQAYGYYKREDIGFHYALADSFTIADHYHVSILHSIPLIHVSRADFKPIYQAGVQSNTDPCVVNLLTCIATV